MKTTITLIIVLVAVVVIAIVAFGVFKSAGSISGSSLQSSGSSSGSGSITSYPNLGLLNAGDVGSVLGGSWNQIRYYQGSNLSKSPGAIRVMNVKYLGLANFTSLSQNMNRTYNIYYAEFSNPNASMQIYKLGTANMNPAYNGSLDGANYTMLENAKGGVEIFYANYYNYDIVMFYQQNNTSEAMPNESDMVKLLQIEISTTR